MAQVVLYPSQDTGVYEGSSVQGGYNTDSILYVGKSSVYMSEMLMQFDLSSIPSNAVISNVDITMTLAANYKMSLSNTIHLSRITSSWYFGTVIWNTKPSASTDYHYTFDVNTSTGVGASYSLNITGLVNAWRAGTPNYGIRVYSINPENDSYKGFGSSKHGTVSYRPKLVVTYNTPPTAPTNVVLSSGTLKGGQNVNFTASGGTDPDGDAISYEYWYSYDNSSWVGFTSAFQIANDNTKTTLYIRTRTVAGGQISGYYTKTFTVIQNTAPSITGTNSDLGTISIVPNITYQVSDVDAGNTVTVVEKVDSTILKSFTATQNTDYSLTFTPLQWLKVSQGAHSLYIEATDNGGLKTTRTYTFVRAETQMDFELKTPFTTDVSARRILLTLDGNIPNDVVATIEVCNNAFDAVPTWENATNMVLQGLPYPFENTVKTAETWGISFKIHIDRDTAVGEIYLDSIGGAFD